MVNQSEAGRQIGSREREACRQKQNGIDGYRQANRKRQSVSQGQTAIWR